MTHSPRRRARARLALLRLGALPLLAILLTAGCLGGSKKKNATPTPSGATGAAVAPSASPVGVAPTLRAGTPAVRSATPPVPFTPSPPTPSPTPTPAPTPAVRDENGLKIQDVSFDATVIEAGGVRIRSAPAVDPGNVVGSVPEGAKVSVEGKVLNGAEAEQGKGTVWCVVGVKQYIYCGEGYIQPMGATPAAR